MRFEVDYRQTPFLESEVGAQADRLNWRCELLLTRNRDALQGKRVLDLASHDGRFSYGALKLGASFVTGVEGRPELAEKAREVLPTLGIGEGRFRFEAGDLFEWLPKFEPGEFDVILCFGFLYHTIRQVEFFREMQRLAPELLLIDSTVQTTRAFEVARWLRLVANLRPRHLDPEQLRRLRRGLERGRESLVFVREDSSLKGSTIEAMNWKAVPTKELLARLLEVHGFEPREIDWLAEGIDDWSTLDDYEQRARTSFVAPRRSGG